MINYAHRGASEYAPENTMSAFYLGLQMGANAIETDVRKTKDGVLVLFHDHTLERVTDTKGVFHDFTHDQLRAMRITGKNPENTPDCTVTLADFLNYFGWRGIRLAVELKDEEIEGEVLDLIREYRAEANTEITSFSFENLKRMRALDEKMVLGYLVKQVDEDVLAEMKRYGIQQICPKADSLTAEQVASFKAQGFSVRAWGVSDENVMRHAVSCGVDGMTVNFPDKLAAYCGRE